MIISEEEAKRRLESPRNVVVRPMYRGGRTKGADEIPDFMKVIIGAAANNDTVKNVSEAFGVSKSVVENYKDGKLDKAKAPDPDFENKVKSAAADKKSKVQDKALDLVLSTMGLLPKALLDPKIKGRDLASIAKDMSAVVDKMSPKDGNFKGAGVVIINAPRMREEPDFQVIDIEGESDARNS